MGVDRRRVPAHLHERYGIRPRRTWLLAAAGLLAGGGALFTMWQIGTDLAAGGEATLIGWQAEPGNASIRWSVHRYDDAPVWCVLRAQDADRFDIGYAVVKVQHTAQLPSFQVTLNTRGEAFTVVEPVCLPNGPENLLGPHFRPGLLPPPQGGGLAAPWQPEPGWLNP